MANLASIAMLADLEGVLVVDKPAGIAAHDVMSAVKRHFNLVKLGHGGTLAGNVSGVFPLLLGDATRTQNEFLNADSVYEGVFTLGRETVTFDREGAVTRECPVDDVTQEKIESALGEFRGDVFLSEPEFSAVRIPGHEGYDILKTADAASPRLYHVYGFKVISFSGNQVSFRISCTKQTPIRSLVSELGKSIGCGASIDSLRRVSLGKLNVDGAVTFAKLLTKSGTDLLDLVRPVYACL